MATPTTVSELWPSKYLRADDIPSGKAYTLTIERISWEQMRSKYTNQMELKCVVYFAGAKRGLVINKTQAVAIADIVGSAKFADWVGKRVSLRTGRATNGKPTIVVGAPVDKSPGSML